MNKKVLQVRTNALSAQYIYTRKLERINSASIIINILTIITPIFILASLLIFKGGDYESIINNASIILSGILLSLSIFSLIIKIEDKKLNYSIGRRSNISVAEKALKNLNKNDDELEWFDTYISEMDSKDVENIGTVDKKLSQEAMRFALKQQHPGEETICSICHTSPFNYKPGSCDVCGNTPTVKGN